LVTLAVGRLVSRDIGPRSKVWSEESQIEAAAYEFAETEKYLACAEDLLGPYIWGNYDILLLPPSFPYGGMENPQLTFVTPTLIAGDRSLANVIVHEIVHSWCGNLVTNRDWEHFWLNEGFTQFNERKILGRLANSEKVRQLECILGLNDLKTAVDRFGHEHPFTQLVVKLDDVDPDDCFSSIPYEKGSYFLFYLENIVGGPQYFEPFMREWIKKYQYLTVTSNDFKNFFLEYFSEKKDSLQSIDWDKWFYAPGMPLIQNNYDYELANSFKSIASEWIKKSKEINEADVKSFNVDQRCGLIEELYNSERAFTEEEVEKIANIFSNTKNSEIKFSLFKFCIKHEYKKIFPEVKDFLVSQGRMKYVRPLYRSLYTSQSGKELATQIFKENKSTYHPVCSAMLSKDLNISDK